MSKNSRLTGNEINMNTRISHPALDKFGEPRESSTTIIRYYINIARPDHWFKNVFVLPGICLALLVYQIIPDAVDVLRIIFGLFIVCLTASANYVINEIVDSEYDKFHPTKKYRPIPSGKIKLPIAYVEWIFLVSISIYLSSKIDLLFMLVTIAFVLQGIIYNIPPIRLKDISYFDVLAESVNNPIRLLLGWSLVDSNTIPTLSLIMAYWMVGAFFMASKRYSEFIMFNDRKKAGAYRNSFKKYSQERLLMTMFFYASLFSFFMGIFLIRYRIELLFSIPLIALVISYYLKMSLSPTSLVQNPEKLFKNRKFLLITFLLVLVTVALFLVDIPFLSEFFSPVAPYYPYE